MDYINYTPVNTSPSLFEPNSGASAGSPKTLYHVHTDIVYVNTGSGWQAGIQPASNSVYSAVSGASAVVKAAVVASVESTATLPSKGHTAVATKTVNVIKNGH